MDALRSRVQVPPGVQCFVGDEARSRRRIEERVVSVFEGWDYEEIIPPLFDYADVFEPGGLGPRTYSFVGRDGSLLALRPDFTSLLAKVAAGRLAHRPPPIRLYYSGEVLRYEPPKAGRQSELHQMGLEHLGGDPRSADGEMLAVAAECLESAGARDWVLVLGHAGVFGGLVADAGLEGAALALLRDGVEAKNAGQVAEILAAAGRTPREAEPLVRLPALAGDPKILEEAASVVSSCPAATAALHELRARVADLTAAGLGARLAIDLGEVRGLDYYTGLVFRVYAAGLGFEVGGGGRYDGLLARFGRPLPAVGFMLGLDRLALLLERQGRLPSVAHEGPEIVNGPAGQALGRARAVRRAGGRVRLDTGGQP